MWLMDKSFLAVLAKMIMIDRVSNSYTNVPVLAYFYQALPVGRNKLLPPLAKTSFLRIGYSMTGYSLKVPNFINKLNGRKGMILK